MLNVKFKYEENKIIGTDFFDSTPIFGNQISFNVLGQDFVENFSLEPKETMDERSYAKMFGKKLEEIGRMIQRQAEFGKPYKMIIDEGTPFEKTLTSF